MNYSPKGNPNLRLAYFQHKRESKDLNFPAASYLSTRDRP